MFLISSHEQLRAAVAAGQAKVDYSYGWQARLEKLIGRERPLLFGRDAWDQRVLSFLANPENAELFKELHRDGIDIWDQRPRS